MALQVCHAQENRYSTQFGLGWKDGPVVLEPRIWDLKFGQSVGEVTYPLQGRWIADLKQVTFGVFARMDLPELKPAIARPSSGRNRNASEFSCVANLRCRVADIVVLGGTFVGVALLPTLQQSGGSAGRLLLAGISVRNAVIAAICIATWAMILDSIGIYGAIRLRSVSEYILRCVIGLNCCTVVVGLIQLVLLPRADVLRFMEIHWMVCFVLLGSLRVLLWQTYQWTSGSRLE